MNGAAQLVIVRRFNKYQCGAYQVGIVGVVLFGPNALDLDVGSNHDGICADLAIRVKELRAELQFNDQIGPVFREQQKLLVGRGADNLALDLFGVTTDLDNQRIQNHIIRDLVAADHGHEAADLEQCEIGRRARLVEDTGAVARRHVDAALGRFDVAQREGAGRIQRDIADRAFNPRELVLQATVGELDLDHRAEIVLAALAGARHLDRLVGVDVDFEE